MPDFAHVERVKVNGNLRFYGFIGFRSKSLNNYSLQGRKLGQGLRDYLPFHSKDFARLFQESLTRIIDVSFIGELVEDIKDARFGS